jgi:hypothetical protein
LYERLGFSLLVWLWAPLTIVVAALLVRGSRLSEPVVG